MALQKATRVNQKLRVLAMGLSGGGKTYSLLLLAYGLVYQRLLLKNGQAPTPEEVWDKIVLADSERGRGQTYANRTDMPFPTGEYWYLPIEAPYHPEKYINAVQQAYETVGEEGVIILDSISHPWNYEGGINDINAEIAKNKGNSYTAWQESGKIHNNFVDFILSANMDVLCTVRSKMDYVLVTNDKGKSAPQPVGLKPIQRDDLEYEFDIALMLNKQHQYQVIKDTTFLGVTDDWRDPITPQLGMDLVDWLSGGVEPAEIKERQRKTYIATAKEMAKADPGLKTYYKNLTSKKTDDLTLEEVKDVLQKFREFQSQ